MVRYFFDVRDGDALVRDDEGEELLNIADAQIEAAGTSADMAKDLSIRAPAPSGHPMSASRSAMRAGHCFRLALPS